MSNTYNGNDRIDKFFAHYGRNGMKQEKSIYEYLNSAGEKAKADKEQAASSAKTQETKRREALLNAERKKKKSVITDANV